MAGGAGWGQTEYARKVWASSRNFASRMRDRMRPKHYPEVTPEEREKSGRKFHLPETAIRTKRKANLPVVRIVIYTLVFALSGLSFVFFSGLALILPVLMVILVWWVIKDIWNAHHPELPKVEKKHIRLKFKR